MAFTDELVLKSKVTENVARTLGWAIATDPQWAGGAKTDGSNAATAINAALAASSTSVVYLPPGIYTITSSINLVSNKRITGAGRNSVLLVGSTVATAALLGSSASAVADVRLDFFKIDMAWAAGRTAIHAIQITNGARPSMDHLQILNSGGAGILLQGLNAGGGTPDAKVTNCTIDGTGLADLTIGFGIQVKDNSPRAIIADNKLRNIKGGMGIGMNGSVGTGFPTQCVIANNSGTMAPSTTGFEFIGITAGCNHNSITGNTTDQTYDNGISISGNYNAVTGNVVTNCWNHGIGVAGSGNTIVGNTIRNVGRENSSQYGGVSIDAGAWNTVANNFIFDDNADASPNRMSFMVKFVNSGGNNNVGPNTGYGWQVGQFTPLNSGRVPTDAVMDVSSGTWRMPGLVLSDIAGAGKVLRLSTDNLSRWTVLANSSAESGANAGSDFEIRAYSDTGADLGPALSISRATRAARFRGGALTVDEGIEITNATAGMVLKSANGTRYRLTVGDDGALTTTAI